MAARRLDAEIDRLYQLPLDEFTAARNALAKEAGADGASIRGLTKPPLAAWAVNQLFWQRHDVYDALVQAANAQRAAHAAVLAGKAADLRGPGKAHDEALDTALKTTLAILRDAGTPATDATKGAIATTLRSLPAAEAPGRLDRTLQPGGFELLAGLPVRPAPAGRPTRQDPRGKTAPPRREIKSSKKSAPDTRAVSRAREDLASATRALRAAEHTARREEFEAARAAREAEKASRAVEAAREALQAAQESAEEAEREAAAARNKDEAAARRAREADDALAAARARADAAQRQLEALTR